MYTNGTILVSATADMEHNNLESNGTPMEDNASMEDNNNGTITTEDAINTNNTTM